MSSASQILFRLVWEIQGKYEVISAFSETVCNALPRFPKLSCLASLVMSQLKKWNCIDKVIPPRYRRENKLFFIPCERKRKYVLTFFRTKSFPQRQNSKMECVFNKSFHSNMNFFSLELTSTSQNSLQFFTFTCRSWRDQIYNMFCQWTMACTFTRNCQYSKWQRMSLRCFAEVSGRLGESAPNLLEPRKQTMIPVCFLGSYRFVS